MTTFPMPTTEPALSARDDRAPAQEIDTDPGIADLLDSIGAGPEAYTVTVYRGHNQQGEFLTTYDGPEFSLARVQADYGAGRYYGQVKRDKRVYRGVRFAIGPMPRSAEPAPKLVPAAMPAPAPTGGIDAVTLLMGQLDRQQQMILALLKDRPAAPVAPVDPLAGLDRVLKLVQPRTQLTEVLEAMRAVREIAASEGGGGGSEWAGLIQSLPSLIQSFTQQAGAPGASVENHPLVAKARQIIAIAEARKSRPVTMPPATFLASDAAIVKAVEPAAAVAPDSSPAAPADFRVAWIREALPLLRLVLTLPDFDADTYAQVAIDAIEARGFNVGDVIGQPGELTDMVLAEAPDLAAHRAMLAILEANIRDAEQPEDDEADAMVGAVDDNGRPRAGDPRQYPSNPKTPAA